MSMYVCAGRRGGDGSRKLKCSLSYLSPRSSRTAFLLSVSFSLYLCISPFVHCACMSSNTQYVLSPSLSLSLCLLMCPPFPFSLIHLFRAADCLLPESVLPTARVEIEQGSERKEKEDGAGDDCKPCGTCAVHLFQMGDTQIYAIKRGEMSCTSAAVHSIWPDIIQRADRYRMQNLKEVFG